MRLAIMTAIILGLFSFSAQAETSVASAPRKIELEDSNNARFVQPGCSILASKNPENIKRAESDRMLTISIWECSGAMKGVTELMMMEHEYCPPDDSRAYWKDDQILDKYMKNHPNALDHPIGVVFYNAFHEAWPCPKEPAITKGAAKDSPSK
jgi:hypothetical protein